MRLQAIEKGQSIDWTTAESLAFGTLLTEGFSVRLSGQDSGRGTFSQRHAVLRNQDSHERYIPLNNIKKGQKNFEIIDSLLSEFAVLGFEFGYSLSEPETRGFMGSSIWRFCQWSTNNNRSIYFFWRV